MNWTDIFSILPLTVLIVWALLMLLAGLWIPKKAALAHPILAVVGLVLAGAALAWRAGQAVTGFGGMVQQDGFSVFLDGLFLLSGLLTVLLSPAYLKRVGIDQFEYYSLLLLSLSGMLLMASAANLIIVFLALELLSIPLYVLAGIARPRPESEEAALKYFLLGSFASGFVLFGTAFLFGGTASTGFSQMAAAIQGGTANLTFVIAGGALLLIGLGFKIAVVPFHAWAPDVYQGAPSSVTAFMAVGAKAAGMAALLRLFLMVFPAQSAVLAPIFAGLAALTMLVGNLLALVQTHLKRLLAYVGIASAGYLLMAFVPFGNPAVSADALGSALFYLLAFALTSFGAWAVLLTLEAADGTGLSLDSLAGLGKRAPLLAAAMTVSMLSFTGIPLTLGFWGKFYLFRTAIAGGYVWLAVLGLLTSLLAAYVAFRVIREMYFREGEPQLHISYWTNFVAIFCALCVVVLSFIPAQLFDLAAKAVLGGA
jgi:proton-translocating NADH-quinone oxidoreductase, chain N